MIARRGLLKSAGAVHGGFIVGGGSGHRFEHGPAFGERVAATAHRELSLSRFEHA